MNRFSLQRVSDKEVNSVLMQIQDALNALADAVTAKEALAKKQAQTSAAVNALRVAVAKGSGGSALSLRLHMQKDAWYRIDWQGEYETVPSYFLRCYSESDINRQVTPLIRSVTATGIELKVREACVLTLIEGDVKDVALTPIETVPISQ